jgi:CRISPR-associated endonuclease Csn1
MKNILGLDLGTNSIGWAKISIDEENNRKPEIKLGSRIIPMTQDVLGKFDSGVTESETAKRTQYRGTRRLRERCLQRRERLFRVLHTLNFLPSHFDNAIGWNKNDNRTYGKFIDSSEPKIAWSKGIDGKMNFVFIDSFYEMLEDFKENQPQLVENGKKIPFDWTLYYLRKKALTRPISKQELAWILLSFNQKRGYYQLRGEEEEINELKKEEYYVLKVVKVEETEERRGADVWYNIHLENGWIYRRASKIPLTDWEGKFKEFIVTTEFEPDGKVKLNKEGEERRSFRAPNGDDWNLQKKRVESSIEQSGKEVGEYIYDNLLRAPYEKVRGKLVRVVERKFYKQELLAILKKQTEFIPELTNVELYENCIKELYAKNIAHQDSLRKKDLIYMLVEDLLFYQRPLKSKKSLIDNCPYESYQYVDKETGEIKIQHIKCIAKSNPYFQEFRLWQFIQNLRVFKRGDINDEDVTEEYLKNEEDYIKLYKFLNDKDKIKQDVFLKDFLKIKKPKGKDAKYPLRWNYVEDKDYPCNTTRHALLNALKKAEIDTAIIDNKDEEYRLWHLLYSVNDKTELQNALNKYAKSHQLPAVFAEEFGKIKPFDKEYGAYSEKAIKKLLSVMRMGEMWKIDEIPDSVEKVIAGEIDEKILQRLDNSKSRLQSKQELRGLPVWQACYVVYGRHSEAEKTDKWNSPEDLSRYIRSFKQHSLRNPIVEQCVLETLRTVHDIWVECGHIDEIHVELGRNMKSTAEQRKRDTERNQANENTNIRIKQLLMELKNDSSIKDVRPYSPMQQEILRIYEEGALQELKKDDKDYADIMRISHLATPTQSEMTRYKLWLEQKYRSPYTGNVISLSKLFTPAYQIEHIIPQSRYFDDSLSNKVICEAEVNSRKANMLGMEFIKQCGGEIIHCATLGDVKVFNENEYANFVKEHYAGNKAKAKKLMAEDLPEEFLQRQMNDTRYISKVINGLLSNVVREDGEIEATSKNVIPCNGGITTRLKNDWGLNNVWNTIVYPRFERLNRMTSSDAFGKWENKDGKRVFQTSVPIELAKGYSKKRIDHRHHAMDALVIALASRNIVNYLNNESAKDTKRREDLRYLLCEKNTDKKWVIRKPWATFTEDALTALQDIVVSFKHYVRVLNKASNYYEHYDSDGKKVFMKQQSNNLWAIRKPLHKETIHAHVNLKRIKTVAFSKALADIDSIVDKELRKTIKRMLQTGIDIKSINKQFKNEFDYKFNGVDVSKVDVYYFTDDVEPISATRKQLDTTFDKKKINSITDTGIQKILLNYLAAKNDEPAIAFSPEGIMELNENIALYNNGKEHKPIIKVRVSEPLGEKYIIGETGSKCKKYAEAQSGTNLYFAIYEDAEGKRYYKTIPLYEVAERMKQGLSPVPEKNENNVALKFYLSPNDLVYVPNEEEKNSDTIDLRVDAIYKFVSASGYQGFFVRNNIATVIANKIELFSLNKMEKTMEGTMIKASCWKLEVDRLGNVTNIIR